MDLEVGSPFGTPYKVKCFTWLVSKEACLTQSNLQKRGAQLCNKSVLCEAQMKDDNHLFLDCSSTQMGLHVKNSELELLYAQTNLTFFARMV